jgi:hypothetical protein
MIKKAAQRGELEGVKVCRGAPIISHLLFADDSPILIRRIKRLVKPNPVSISPLIQRLK